MLLKLVIGAALLVLVSCSPLPEEAALAEGAGEAVPEAPVEVPEDKVPDVPDAAAEAVAPQAVDEDVPSVDDAKALPPVEDAVDPGVAPVPPATDARSGADETPLVVPPVAPGLPSEGSLPLLPPGSGFVHEEKSEGSQQHAFKEGSQAAEQGSSAAESGDQFKNVQGYENQGGFRKADGFSESSSNRYGSGNFQGSESHDTFSKGQQGAFGVTGYHYGVHGNPQSVDALKVGFIP